MSLTVQGNMIDDECPNLEVPFVEDSWRRAARTWIEIDLAEEVER